MRRYLIFLIASACMAQTQSPSQYTAGVVAGTTPSITLATQVSYSSNGLISSALYGGGASRIYDVYYPTAVGLNNALPICIYWHSGGGTLINNDKTEVARDQPVMTALAQSLNCNVYAPNYTLGAMLLGSITSGSASATLTANSSNFWPLSGPYGLHVYIADGANSETLVTASTSGGMNITFTGTAAHTHTGVPFYVTETQYPIQIMDLMTFLSYLKTNAGQGGGVPGDPKRIYIFGMSWGGTMALWSYMVNPTQILTDYQGNAYRALNVAPATRGYSEWSATGWNVLSVAVNSAAIDFSNGYAHGDSLSTVAFQANLGCKPGIDTGCTALAVAAGPLAFTSNVTAPRILLEGATGDTTIPPAWHAAELSAAYTPALPYILYTGQGHGLFDLFTNGPYCPYCGILGQSVPAAINFLHNSTSLAGIP